MQNLKSKRFVIRKSLIGKNQIISFKLAPPTFFRIIEIYLQKHTQILLHLRFSARPSTSYPDLILFYLT